MSRRLWLVRHGQTVWNTEQRFCGQGNSALSHEGLAQACWLAACLSTRKISALYSSDLPRAYETAALIAETHPRPLTIQGRAAWREMDFGEWEGLTYNEIVARFPAHAGFFDDPENCSPPGGETLSDLRRRVLAELAYVLEEEVQLAEGDIVIVSHGGPLRLLLTYILGMPPARQWQLDLAPGSLSALDLAPNPDTKEPLATLVLLNMQRALAAIFPPLSSEVDRRDEL